MVLNIEDIDASIWRDELDGVVPQQIHDAHTHVYRGTDSRAPEQEPASWRAMYCSSEGNLEDLRAVDAALLPGRTVSRFTTGGMVMLHLSRKTGIADPDNLADLERLAGRYPNVQWNLCHAARSYVPAFLERSADRLRTIPNLWSDTSSVCDADALTALISILGADRMMYGSDDLTVSARRGKYITFGYAWVDLNEGNSPFHPDHCDPRMTYIRYESLRALKRAAGHLALSHEQIQNLFLGNAQALLSIVKKTARQTRT